jgi:hypothetical protein
MPQYRAYSIDESGRVFAPPKIIEAGTGAEAIAQAMHWVDGHALEIWDEAQRIGLIERRPKSRP